MIAIIDYKMGNVRSVAKAFEAVGAHVVVTAEPAELRKARALVLPGVGAFGAGMAHLRKFKLISEIKSAVADHKPFLGICIGFQLLFAESEEHGVHKGLDCIPGSVVRFRSGLKIPHMGWNTIEKTAHPHLRQSPNLLAGIPDGSYFYFVHSYYVKPRAAYAVAVSAYGQKFTAIACKGTTFGIQFHPEKSSDRGLTILKNFCRIAGEIEA